MKINQQTIDQMIIKLDGTNNTRDVSGYQGKDGRGIRPGRLLRSDTLSKLTDQDIQKLTGEYQLRADIDLRTDIESTYSPDIRMPQVEYHEVPVLKGSALGVTKEAVTGVGDVAQGMIRSVKDMNGESGEYTRNIYEMLVKDDHAIQQYRKFFEILLNQEDGAVLWHCSAGKDRTGMGAAYILSALGVEEETVIEDYLLSNLYLRPQIEAVVSAVAELDDDPHMLEQVRIINGVKREFIENNFSLMKKMSGSIEGYLREYLGLTDGDFGQLYDLYLNH